MSDVPPTSDGSAPAPRPGRPEFRHAKPPPRRRRVAKGLGAVIVLAVVVVVGVVGYGWYRYNQIGREDLALAESVGGVQNFLIVGSDTRSVIDPTDPNYKAFGGDDSPPRSDTIMIARVDPKARTVDLMSFPRDLWVPIMPTGGAERINTAYNTTDPNVDGAQRLVDTIKADFGIDINHYVEIDFASFKGIVDAVGGVPMYFDTPVRDESTGFYQYELGCQTINGEQGLALSRSRHLEYKNSKGNWVEDPSSDLGRIARQQYFLRMVVDRAGAKFGSFDLKAMNDLVSSTSDKLKLDSGLSLGDLASLGKAFKGFGGDQITSHALPVYPYTTNGGALVLKLDTVAAEDVLNVFRGLPAGTVSPASVTVAVSNGSGAPNQATDVSTRLAELGYIVLGRRRRHQDPDPHGRPLRARAAGPCRPGGPPARHRRCGAPGGQLSAGSRRPGGAGDRHRLHRGARRGHASDLVDLDQPGHLLQPVHGYGHGDHGEAGRGHRAGRLHRGPAARRDHLRLTSWPRSTRSSAASRRSTPTGRPWSTSATG